MNVLKHLLPFVTLITATVASAGTPTELTIPLIAPIPGHQNSMSISLAGELAKDISEGTTSLDPEDQRSVVESMIASFTMDHLDAMPGLEDTYLWYLEPGHAYPVEQMGLPVVERDDFVRVYVGLRLLALHDAIGLGFARPETTMVIPNLMYESTLRNVRTYVATKNKRPMDDFERSLEALQDSPEVSGPAEVRDAFAKYVEKARIFIPIESLADVGAAASVEPNRSGKLILPVVSAASVAALYYPLLEAFSGGRWMPLAAIGAVSAVAIFLEVRQIITRRNARARVLGAEIERSITVCENALTRLIPEAK